MKNFNYNQHIDIKYGHQELRDVPRIVKECKEKWFNQTLTKINDSVARLGGAVGAVNYTTVKYLGDIEILC